MRKVLFDPPGLNAEQVRADRLQACRLPGPRSISASISGLVMTGHLDSGPCGSELCDGAMSLERLDSTNRTGRTSTGLSPSRVDLKVDGYRENVGVNLQVDAHHDAALGRFRQGFGAQGQPGQTQTNAERRTPNAER
ncbi:hypothetical protein [Luteitalea pratensis]|uniref:hypothetical protein n=1 Tax=Luteitalea pratensis TaxID=1855912 RepID=UPI0012FF805E|nr:hypothetical protein [Luteitalea pratensis]